jgi:antitoxin (DNA-binding transcriptional repressor) of toxin-antitoxin stability system
MRRIGIEEGRRTLPELASDALAGKATVLTRHGKAVAAIVPLGELAGRRRQARLLSLRGSGTGLWGASPAATIDTLRREWEA